MRPVDVCVCMWSASCQVCSFEFVLLPGGRRMQSGASASSTVLWALAGPRRTSAPQMWRA
jgi:hypothetical protein